MATHHLNVASAYSGDTKYYIIYHIIITKGRETHQSITCGNKTLDIKLNRIYNSNLLVSFNFLET